jgi:ferredoxin
MSPGSGIAAIANAAAACGLLLRGGFHPEDGVDVPALADGRTPGTLLLVGNAGPAMWRVFSASAEAADGQSHPMDRWSRRVIGALAQCFGARPIFPFEGPPYHPFQRWARRAEPVHVSPLGILIHPDYGLWHAYRGALAFAERLELPAADERPSPCDNCPDKPCLSACPVHAFTSADYDVAACAGHLDSPGGRDCLDRGCLARRACPVGRDYIYEPEQAAFHMDAFHLSASGKKKRG